MINTVMSGKTINQFFQNVFFAVDLRKIVYILFIYSNKIILFFNGK